MTRVLTRSDLLSALDIGSCVEALREGFRNDDRIASPGSRVHGDLPFPGTATVLAPGLLPGVKAYSVKVNAKFPGARPALRGVICLHRGAHGALLALLDSATVTAWRTGLAAALGTHVLTTAQGTGGPVVGVVGAGAQGELMVSGLRHFRDLQDLLVHDTVADRAAHFAGRHGGRVVGSASEVAAASDTVLLATWSRRPLSGLSETRPGQHFTTLGVDEPGKQELAADLLEASFLVVDDHSLAAAAGVLTGADGSTRITADASLGELLRGGRSGRATQSGITVYAPVGLPRQDLAIAWLAYRQAELNDVGSRVDLLA
ncbi:ornithine cyclodeaminase family protein [Streptomyces griseomycini]|uniref:Ornithine cyclodeaminase n=1 Tax=Streptomyces griseomycini TaxID=66895 RepID=A0A7W7VAQ5_9ACTN|nr:ornithine cyclodeaminase family protein [Streptomyces griseomycini]MBB4903166.1 ornithine cyclodeaminase [Streptomyces griseomycini]GGR58115.1 alanine dehydrogenase [Streptomyces griseomycini]